MGFFRSFFYFFFGQAPPEIGAGVQPRRLVEKFSPKDAAPLNRRDEFDIPNVCETT